MLNTVFAFPLCSVYCNTLLANLNARAYIRGETTMHNTEADLFTSSTSRAPNSTNADKHRSEPRVSFRMPGEFLLSRLFNCHHGAYPMTMVTVANVEGHGGVTFLVANRPTTPTTENVCV